MAPPSMFPVPGVAPGPAYPHPSAFGGLPIPPPVWGAQGPAHFSAAPLSPPRLNWGQPPPGAPVWGQPVVTNPFQPGPFPAMVDHHGPARPPPRPPGKEPAAPPKVENTAFTALDPLGDREKKTGKDMFKDFQIAKPPAIPARKGEHVGGAEAMSGDAGAFDQYFNSKVGLVQDHDDHDDFDINRMSAAVPGKATSCHRLAPMRALCCNVSIAPPTSCGSQLQRRPPGRSPRQQLCAGPGTRPGRVRPGLRGAACSRGTDAWMRV